jgi:ribonuclease HII
MKWVVGIDEVGRGALAGPVVVAAAMISVNSKGRAVHIPFRSLKDSKKMSVKQRERWVGEMKDHSKIKFAVTWVYPRGIERLNISGAANLAALRAFARLKKSNHLPPRTKVFLDGGLFLGSKLRQKNTAKTVIKGDEKIPAVAAASIMAKVTRDRFMVRLAKRYPKYGFEVHKGYGTVIHLRAIEKSGPCAAHRLTFLKNGLQ